MAEASLSREVLVQAALEVFGHKSASKIRHLGIAGKEPLEVPQSVTELALAWHEASPELRPGTLGILTANAAALASQARNWRNFPLSWAIVSADPPATQLHLYRSGLKMIEAAAEAKEVGGIKMAAVNTTITPCSLDKILDIGHRVEAAGLDQWSVGGLYQPNNGRLEDTLPDEDLVNAISAIISDFHQSPLSITINLSPERFVSFAPSPDTVAQQFQNWRLERRVSHNVILIAPNPLPGHFIRLRWDGQMLDSEDLLTVGLTQGKYGRYRRGEFRKALASFYELSNPREAA